MPATITPDSSLAAPWGGSQDIIVKQLIAVAKPWASIQLALAKKPVIAYNSARCVTRSSSGSKLLCNLPSAPGSPAVNVREHIPRKGGFPYA
jgi:hypothetical protein